MRASSSPVPLARLLAIAYRTLIDGLHSRLKEQGYTDIRPEFGYVLLAVRSRATTGVEIAHLLGVTKQAASKLIDAMEAGGYVKRQANGQDARAKAITITARGRTLLTVVEAIYRNLEAEWARVTSRRRVETIRQDLRIIMEAAHGGVLPAIRPTR